MYLGLFLFLQREPKRASYAYDMENAKDIKAPEEFGIETTSFDNPTENTLEVCF